MMLYDKMLFWIVPQESFLFFLSLKLKRHLRSMQSSTMDAMMSVRIMKMWEGTDLPAPAGQEKSWLPQCHFAVAASAAFGHRGDHGTVQQQQLNAHHLC